MMASPQDDLSPPQPQPGPLSLSTEARAFPASHAAGPVAEACRAVLSAYEAGLSPMDAEMLDRLIRLGDLIPSILADEARLTMAFGALRQVMLAFDSAEHRDAGRQPQASAALLAVYRLLGLAWPAQP